MTKVGRRETVEAIRPHYQALQGYLAQAPEPQYWCDWNDGNNYWRPVNKAIEDIIEITSDSVYERSKVKKNRLSQFDATSYRQQINALINNLHGVYFQEEPLPFSGQPTGPSTVITQTQEQSTLVSIIFDLHELVLDKLDDESIDEKERSFFEKLRENIRGVTSFAQLIILLLRTAQ